MKFSIIIPAYNVEQYINEVVQSVLDQDFDDYEIIIVDDGSNEKCRNMCDELDRKHKQVSVLHKENGGVSSARNVGMKIARGEYVFFLDGDDRMAENLLSRADHEICKSHPDVIASTKHVFTDWGKTYYREQRLDRPKNQGIDELKQRLGHDVYISHNIYSKSFLDYTDIDFDEEIKVSEDVLWLFKVMAKVRSASVIDGFFYYHYEGRPDSLINGFKLEYYLPTLNVYKMMFDSISDIEYNNIFVQKKYVAGIYWNFASQAAVYCSDKFVWKQCEKHFNDNIYIVNGNHCKVIYRLLWIRFLIGTKKFLKILYWLLQLKFSLKKVVSKDEDKKQ